jgi:hypothetical protein
VVITPVMAPQERLAQIVAEIGLDGALNLLAAFECIPAAA